MLIDNERKTVELFIENLLWGRITADFLQLMEKGDWGDYVNDLYDDVKAWKYLHKKSKKSNTEKENYRDLSFKLYNVYMEGRIDGTIKGELKDENIENNLKELKEENEIFKEEFKKFTSNIIKLEGLNHKLHDENVILANELEDLKNIVDSYESASLKK